ncbi:MAG: OmpA family protein, partial [Longimicrobiales bacterium]
VTQLTRLPASLHIDLIGHADIIGSDAVNDPLSERRAAAVQNFLSQWGINSHRLTTDGRGKREPVVGDGRNQLDRRVELRFFRTELPASEGGGTPNHDSAPPGQDHGRRDASPPH